MAASDGFADFTRHVNPSLGHFLAASGRDQQFQKADGCTLTSAGGEVYTDWVSGFGALNFGHNPGFVREVIEGVLASQAPNLYSEALNPFAGRLARRLVQAAGPSFETCFFANGGAEAVEAALKTALLASGRPRVAYATGGYHGTTLGALGLMADGLYRDPFRHALAPIFEPVPFGDAEALARCLARADVAAFVLEPIQMEAGARIAEDAYLREVRSVCDRHGALLIFDEIQTGLGRTGQLFAFQHSGVAPDLFTLGKSLGAGSIPISATVMREGVWRRAYGSLLRSEIHNSTLGGNALAAAVACAALERAGDPEFLARVRATGQELERLLRTRLERFACVRRISLRGLLGGIEFDRRVHPWASWAALGMPELEPHASSGALVVQRLSRRGILAQLCGHDWSVLRIEPPLVVSRAQCAEFVEALADGVDWLENNACV
jgi:putrescine aminotransferase